MRFGFYPEATINSLSMIRGRLQVRGDTVLIPRWFNRAIRCVEYKKVTAAPMVCRPFRMD